MHKSSSFASLLLVLLLSTLSCNLLTVEEEALDYPTVFPEINFPELQEMTAAYHAANDNHICSTLNKYGFTGFSEIFFEEGENPCATREKVRVELTNFDSLITVAKESLLKNQKYTGVSDTTNLAVTNILPISGCTICEDTDPNYNNVPIELRITFGEQEVDSNKVIDTEIIVFIDAEGVNRIWGNWYPDFEVPDFVNIGYEEVQEGLVGWQIDMRSYTGEQKIYTVQNEDLTKKPEKVHLPIEAEDGSGLVIRTCWAISISYSDGSSFEGWIAYIDMEEGFMVKVDPI